jgi:hypothetical protein
LAVFLVSFFFLFLIFGITANLAKAEEKRSGQKSFLEKLNINYIVQVRGPNNFIPSDDVIVAPDPKKHWLQEIIVEDDKGVLVSMRDQVNEWSKLENYLETWHLEDSGVAYTTNYEDKVKFLKRHSLKYLDKLLTGEIKTAKKGSTLHTVGTVQQALKPESDVQISDEYKLKFRAKVLQGEATLLLENPYVESEAKLYSNGEVNLYVSKQIVQLGMGTHLDYNMTKSEYTTYVDKSINDYWSTRLTSIQSDQNVAFSGQSNRILSIQFNSPF